MVDNQKLFSSYPCVGEEFNGAGVDCIKIYNIDGSFYYNPIIKHAMLDSNGIAQAGLTILTGAMCEDMEELAHFVSSLLDIGFFNTGMYETGLIISEIEETETINWTHLLQLHHEKYNETETTIN